MNNLNTKIVVDICSRFLEVVLATNAIYAPEIWLLQIDIDLPKTRWEKRKIQNRNLGDCEDGLDERLFLCTAVVFWTAKLFGLLLIANFL